MFKLKYKDFDFQIDDNLNTLIVSNDETSLLDLIKEIAGINKSNVCLDDVNVFDNISSSTVNNMLFDNSIWTSTLSLSIFICDSSGIFI